MKLFTCCAVNSTNYAETLNQQTGMLKRKKEYKIILITKRKVQADRGYVRLMQSLKLAKILKFMIAEFCGGTSALH